MAGALGAGVLRANEPAVTATFEFNGEAVQQVEARNGQARRGVT